MMILLGLAMISWLLIRSSGFQTWLANQFTEKFKEEYGGQLEVGRVHVRIPKTAILEDILLRDQLGDTLIFIPKLTAGINKLDLKQRYFKLGRIKITDPYFQLLEDPGGGYNFDFLLDILAARDTLKPAAFVRSPIISAENTRLVFRKFGAVNEPGVFNPENFAITGFDLNLMRFVLHQDSVAFSIRNSAFRESSGMFIKDLDGIVNYYQNTLTLDGLNLRTEFSQISIPHADLRIKDSGSDAKLADRLEWAIELDNPTIIRPEDIVLFYADEADKIDIIDIVGNIKFDGLTWDLNDMNLYIGDWLGFEGSIKARDPSDIRKAYIDANVDTLFFNLHTAKSSYLSLLVDLDTVDLPFNTEDLGVAGFRGMLYGRYKDFDYYGELTTAVGSYTGDLSIHPQVSTGLFDVISSYRVSFLHFDHYLNQNTGLGLISVEGDLEGIWDGDTTFTLRHDAILPFIQWRDYYYTNIDLKSIVKHNLYEASVRFGDDNGEFDIYGRVDLTEDDPVFDFDIAAKDAELAHLNLYSADTVALLDLNLHASFSGKEIDDIIGHLWIEDSRFQNSRGEIPIKELSLDVSRDFDGKKINLESEYIDGRMVGDIFLDDLIGQLSAFVGKFLPLNVETRIVHEDRLNDFTFNINFKNPRPITDVLASDFAFKENSKLGGFFRYGGRELELEGDSPQFLFKGRQFTDFWFRVFSVGSDLELVTKLGKIELDQDNVFNDFQLNATMLPDIMETNIKWAEIDSIKFISEISPSLAFEKGSKTLPRLIIDIPNSTIFFKQKQWEIEDSRLEIEDKYFSVNGMRLSHEDEHLNINGVISDNPQDTLQLSFNSVDLGIVNQFASKEGLDLSGLIQGDAKIFNFYDGGLFLADLVFEDFAINDEPIGLTEVHSRRSDDGKDVLVNVLTRRGDISTLRVDGRYSPSTDELDFLFALDKLKLNIFDAFLTPVLSDVTGIASGQVKIVGTRKKPLMDGLINIQKGGFTVDYLNTRYKFTHPIKVQRDAFLVENLVARDSFGNEAVINGGIRHTSFKDLRLDFNIDAKNFMFMDTKEFHGNGYWGRVFGTGIANLTGPFGGINIDVSARTTGNSQFSIPVGAKGNNREFDFISFVVPENPDEDPDLISFVDNKNSGNNSKIKKLQVDLDLDVTPEAEALIIFDAQVGNVLRGRGSGNLSISLNNLGLFELNGDYIIDEGDYLFTVENIPIKRFAIEPGSAINMTGQVDQAQLDIDAVYNTQAALYDLLQEATDELAERVPVTCHLFMKGVLANPDITFAINLPPSSDDVARSQLESLTEDELQKQLFSLLVLNRFQPLPGLSSNSSSRNYGGAGLATTTSVLSSQLNYWLSQISNDFDIGFNYRPGDQITSDEVEVALSTQIFDNRMTINLNGNMDMRSSQDETNQLVGDVEVEYKIRPSGKVRVKAFNRSNDRLIYEYSPYTQGLGLFFREEFDTFRELYKRYWDNIVGKDKKGN